LRLPVDSRVDGVRSIRFATIPSRPIRQACSNTRAPQAALGKQLLEGGEGEVLAG
jgi:hypothetical protein